jgi:hypothetical protein
MLERLPVNPGLETGISAVLRSGVSEIDAEVIGCLEPIVLGTTTIGAPGSKR